MYNFNSDYLEGCAPEILEELIKTNTNQVNGYGNDEYCKEAIEAIKYYIGKNDVDIHLIPGGTPCNILAISSALKPYEAVIAATTGHISVHETGAIEATGHKVIEVSHNDGKISPQAILDVLNKHTDEHMVKPKMVYISNPTEYGTLYSYKELKLIRDICDDYGLYLYLDGARLGSALVVNDYDVTLQDITSLCDVYYIGGTKNGALLGEALVVVNNELKPCFRYNIKQKGQMLAKGRILGITFKTLFTDDLYFNLARHANKNADALRYVFKAFGIKQYVKSLTNQTFVILDNKVVKGLSKKYQFEVWETLPNNKSVCRFVTSWCTREEAILELAEDIKPLLGK